MDKWSYIQLYPYRDLHYFGVVHIPSQQTLLGLTWYSSSLINNYCIFFVIRSDSLKTTWLIPKCLQGSWYRKKVILVFNKYSPAVYDMEVLFYSCICLWLIKKEKKTIYRREQTPLFPNKRSLAKISNNAGVVLKCTLRCDWLHDIYRPRDKICE